MTNEEKIEQALYARVDTLPAVYVYSPELTLAYPNVEFPGKNGDGTEKTTPAMYVRVEVLPNDTEREFINPFVPHRHFGILQLTVVSLPNLGWRPATKLAGEIAEHFSAGQEMYAEGAKVKITSKPSRARAFIDRDATWNVPVSIPYECFI